MSIARTWKFVYCFFFNDTATTEIYTLSLHDALPIWRAACTLTAARRTWRSSTRRSAATRSEEHTSELQSLTNLVCRLLLEKKTKNCLPIYYVNIIINLMTYSLISTTQ